MKFDLKEFFKENIPFLQRWYEKWKYRKSIHLSQKDIFKNIYKSNYWKDKESVSGQGSNSIQTVTLREELPKVLDQYNVRSLLDIPCGDFNWMKDIASSVKQYYGIDIVDELIEQHIQKYSDTNIHFRTGDITKDDLPQVDLVLVRDLFIHFSNEDVFKSLNNLRRSGSKYLLTTIFTKRKKNYDVHTGSWRPINLMNPPFHFPQPLLVINENCTEHNGRYADKSLALWKIKDIPTYF